MLNGIDVLVLHYLNGKNEDYQLKQAFWKHRYSLNPKKTKNKLIREGYIFLEFDAVKSLHNLKLKDLKNILHNNNLPMKGVKNDLVNRIIDNIDISTLNNSLKKTWYPSNKAKEIINKTDYILYAHNNSGIDTTIIDLYNTQIKNPNMNSKEILIESINKNLKFNVILSIYGLFLSSSLYDISKICRHYDDPYGQYTYLIKSIVFKFVNNGTNFNHEYLKENFNSFMDNYSIPDFIITDLKNVLSNNPSYFDSLKKQVESNGHNGNFYPFGVNDIYNIMIETLNLNEDEVLSIYVKAFLKLGGKRENLNLLDYKK